MNSRSSKLVNGGEGRKNKNDPPSASAQSHDECVGEPEGHLQKRLATALKRSHVSEEQEPCTAARFDPVRGHSSTGWTPEKKGRPRTDTGPTAKVQHRARDKPSLSRHFEPLAAATRESNGALGVNKITGEQIVDLFERRDDTSLNHLETHNDWSGTQLPESKKKKSDVPELPRVGSGTRDSPGDNTTSDSGTGDSEVGDAATEPTLLDDKSFSSWGTGPGDDFC